MANKTMNGWDWFILAFVWALVFLGAAAVLRGCQDSEKSKLANTSNKKICICNYLKQHQAQDLGKYGRMVDLIRALESCKNESDEPIGGSNGR